MKNIRHEIDPFLVEAQIESKVADHNRFRITLKEREVKKAADWEKAKLDESFARWGKPPAPGDIEAVDIMMDDWIDREWNTFAFVRVIELPLAEGNRFILVYGDADDDTVTEGTGRFATLEKAKDWFLNGGR